MEQGEREGAAPTKSQGGPRKVILDTDGGVDDLLAVLLALASPLLNVLAITTVHSPLHKFSLEMLFEPKLSFDLLSVMAMRRDAYTLIVTAG